MRFCSILTLKIDSSKTSNTINLSRAKYRQNHVQTMQQSPPTICPVKMRSLLLCRACTPGCRNRGMRVYLRQFPTLHALQYRGSYNVRVLQTMLETCADVAAGPVYSLSCLKSFLCCSSDHAPLGGAMRVCSGSSIMLQSDNKANTILCQTEISPQSCANHAAVSINILRCRNLFLCFSAERAPLGAATRVCMYTCGSFALAVYCSNGHHLIGVRCKIQLEPCAVSTAVPE